MDLSKLSDQDLEAISSGDMSTVSEEGLMHLAGEEPSSAVDTASDALQGFGQGGTLGYLPEAQAALAAGLQRVLPESMGGGGEESYEDLKKYFRTQDIQKQERSPWAYGAGNIGGAVATLPVGGAALRGAGALAKGTALGAKAVKGAQAAAAGTGLGTKLAKGAGIGAAYGGLINPERAPEDDLSMGESLEERAKGAALGGALGFGAELGLAGAGGALQKTGEKLSKSAIVKQIGANAGQIKKIIRKGDFPKLEKFLNENKLLGFGKSLDDVHAKSGQILKTDGPKIGQVYEEAVDAATALRTLDEAAPGLYKPPPRINGEELADNIYLNASSKFHSHPERESILKAIETKTNVLRDMGDNINIKDLHQFRMGLDEGVDWTKATREHPAMQKAIIDARNMVADEAKRVVNELDQIVGGQRGKALKELNEKFSSAALVNNISSQAVGRETAKAFMGAGVIGGGAGLGTGYAEYQRSHSIPKAIGAGLLTGVGVGMARKYGSPIGYKMGKVAQPVGRALEAAGSRPSATGAAASAPWVLMGRERGKQ
jgi:hypothetical protein